MPAPHLTPSSQISPGQLPLSVVTDSSGVNAPLVDGAGNHLVNIPAWQSGLLYPQGYVVQNGGVAYAAATTFTSGASFGADGANWAPLSSAELAYAQITSNVTLTTTLADIAGLSITFVAPTRPVIISFFCYTVQQLTSAGFPAFEITDSSNNVQVFMAAGTLTAANNFSASVVGRVRLGSLTAGQSYTYKIRGNTSANTATLLAAAGYPAFIQAEQV